MQRIFNLLLVLTIGLLSEHVQAENVLQLKFDDGGIIKWHIPEDFEYSFENMNTENFIIPIIKFKGQFSEVTIPVETIEWTFRSADDNVILELEWSDDWGSVVEEYSLTEKEGKVVIGNLPEETAVDICKGYDSDECKNLTVSGQLERDPSDEYHVLKFSATFVIINPNDR